MIFPAAAVVMAVVARVAVTVVATVLHVGMAGSLPSAPLPLGVSYPSMRRRDAPTFPTFLGECFAAEAAEEGGATLHEGARTG
jgi:hypothetical protein